MAGLGHDHVVASHDARGFVDAQDGRADLYVPLHRLSVDAPGLRAEAKLDVAITLHGTTRRFDIPLQTETLPDGLAVSGRLTFHQTDFGLTPYSVLGGALRVQDRLELRFRIVAAGG